MPEEVDKEIKEEPKEKIQGAMLHSFSQDQKQVSGMVVDDPAVPTEEAIMLAEIQTVSNRRRQINFFRTITIFVVLASIFILVFPKLFEDVSTNINTVDTNTKKEIINSDIKYNFEIPNQDGLDDFRIKSFTLDADVSEFVLTKNSQVLNFKSLSPFVSQRFIDGISPVISGEYFYGFYKNENINKPFIILKINNRDESEKVLQTLERTMYSDLGFALQLENDTKNETRIFENFTSVVNPVRELKNTEQKTILVYGFVNDEFVIITGSKETFSFVKQRILNGF